MSDKAQRIAELQDRVPERWGPPPGWASVRELTLLEAGLVCILARHLSGAQVEKTAKALRQAYPDWNELRVSQIQEFQDLVRTKNGELRADVARDVKAYLQEVFQENHGYDLEFLREDPTEAAQFVRHLSHLGASAAHYLLWLASDGAVSVSSGIVRVLDRLGLVRRTSSLRKAQETLAPLVPPDRRLGFAVRFGQVIESWCAAKKPLCWKCVLVDACPHGEKVHRAWKAQQKRIELQRQRSLERRRRDEERAHKRAAQEAARRARLLAQEETRRRREAEQHVKREAQRREAVKRQRQAVRKAAAKERAAKKEAAKKKAAKKKAAKKKAAKKTVAKKKTKQVAKQKTGKHQVAQEKPTTQRSGTSKKKTSTRGTSRNGDGSKKEPARKNTTGGRTRR